MSANGDYQRLAEQFDRALCPSFASLPAYRFRDDSTLANETYWHSRLAFKACSYEIASAEKAGDGDRAPAEALRLEDVWKRPLGATVTGLRAPVRSAEGHMRLTALVHVVSALERYVDEIARLAMLSDPLLIPGFPKKVDGLELLDRRHLYRLRVPPTVDLVKGEWSKRIAAIRDWLGDDVADVFRANESNLEKMREIRNSAAHGLGAFHVGSTWNESSAITNLTASWLDKASAPLALSDDRLLSYMAVCQGIVSRVDAIVLRNFVGAYEVPAVYLSWLQDPLTLEEKLNLSYPGHLRGHWRLEVRGARKFIGTVIPRGNIPSTYVEGMLQYLDQIGVLDRFRSN
ncbi:hypothetical protein [Tsukamurella sp. TY48]|uniref:hypothetical protein n=1 Tax=Tsukamurella TaxID=2060 RepID=UPI001C7D8C98|nr:hypothetical protein [Tsukamurella sp. TY48]